MRSETESAAGSWLIGLIAAALLFWAIAEFLGLERGGGTTGFEAATSVAAEPGALVPRDDAVEMHRLLPDATGHIGRAVLLDGTVVGETSAVGFWVRDLRDNIIFVATVPVGDRIRPEVRAGDAVRVRGVVALLTPVEQAERLAGAGLVLPASAVVVRDVKVQPTHDGVELLTD